MWARAGLFAFEVLAEGGRARPIKYGAELCVAADPSGEVVAVGFAQSADLGVAVLLADLAVGVAMTAIKAGLFVRHG